MEHARRRENQTLRGGAGGDGGGEGDGIASRGAVAARKRRERSMVRSGQVSRVLRLPAARERRPRVPPLLLLG